MFIIEVHFLHLFTSAVKSQLNLILAVLFTLLVRFSLCLSTSNR